MPGKSGGAGKGGAGKGGAGKKGPQKGTGGHGRRKLAGKGPTPKAEERPGHQAYRRARSAAKRATAPRPADAGSRRTGRGAPPPDEIVAGRNAVAEAMRAGVPAVAVYIAVGIERDERVDEIRKLAGDRQIPLLDANRSELDRMAGTAPHQGVVLHARAFDYLHPEDLLRRALEAPAPPLLVAVDGVTDPHNFGAIARSAAAFGAQGVVVPERRAVGVTPAAWKASAGTLAHLPVARATNLVRALTSYAEAGLMIAGLDGNGELDLDDLELSTGPLVLVIGAEGRGLSRLVAQRCDVLVRIPLAGHVESLNASVAAGVVLAEVARQRRRS
jgi:23S rRNA (guanosine2251-2'-O)-methyltransferase